ncbi:hypothetical protein NQZ68_007232, partial [Dissostichus eleginoides]
DYPAETDAEDVSDDNILSPYTSCVAKDSPLESKDGDRENVDSDKNNGGGNMFAREELKHGSIPENIQGPSLHTGSQEISRMKTAIVCALWQWYELETTKSCEERRRSQRWKARMRNAILLHLEVPLSTVHRLVHQGVEDIAALRQSLIKLPAGPELEEVGQGFQQLANCPAFRACVGAIDQGFPKWGSRDPEWGSRDDYKIKIENKN